MTADLSCGFTIEVTLRADGQKPVGTLFDLGNGTAGTTWVIARDDGRVACASTPGPANFAEVVTRDPWLQGHLAVAEHRGRWGATGPLQDASLALTIDGNRRHDPAKRADANRRRDAGPCLPRPQQWPDGTAAWGYLRRCACGAAR